MLYFTSTLKNFNVNATDGEMGKVKDFYFDDQKWGVRYAIIDTRKWLPGRKVVMSPPKFKEINELDLTIDVDYDKETIRKSPSIKEEMSIPYETEMDLSDFFGWDKYWTGNMLWGAEHRPSSSHYMEQPLANKIREELKANNNQVQEHKLISESEIINFKVYTTDGELGRLEDMIIDNEYWKIQYIVVKMTDKIGLSHFQIDTQTILNVDWLDKKIYVPGSISDYYKEKFERKEAILTNL